MQATIDDYKDILEGYATGRFQTQMEVVRYLEDCPEYPKGRDGRVHPQRVHNLLRKPVYAGYVEGGPASMLA